MHYSAADYEDGPAGREENFDRGELQVVVVYDVAPAARQVKDQLQKITDAFAEDLTVRIQWWRLDMIEVADDIGAGEDLENADLLVLALQREPLPGGVNSAKLRRVIQRLTGSRAMLAVLACFDAAPRDSYFDLLEKAAEEARVGFLLPLEGRAPAGGGAWAASRTLNAPPNPARTTENAPAGPPLHLSTCTAPWTP
jgi:hypothetical protein